MRVRINDSVDALMQIEHLKILLELAVLQVIPVLKLLDPHRNDGAAGLGGDLKRLGLSFFIFFLLLKAFVGALSDGF